MRISPNGVAFIKGFEGFSSAPYDDGTGVWTIGYGHIEGVTPRSPHITEPQAARLLQRDLDRNYAPAVNQLGLPLNQNQFDALVSVVYNLGVGIIGPQHDMGRLLRARQYRQAADSFLEYDHAGGVVMEGLRRRRAAERALFLKPVAHHSSIKRRLMNDPIHPKVVGATAATGFAAIIVSILTASGVTVTTGLQGAILSLVALVGGFLTPSVNKVLGSSPAAHALERDVIDPLLAGTAPDVNVPPPVGDIGTAKPPVPAVPSL